MNKNLAGSEPKKARCQGGKFIGGREENGKEGGQALSDPVR